ETISKHAARLADAVGAVDRLGFHRRVPPWIEQENVFGGSQVQTQAACFEADEKELAVGIVLKALDLGAPVACLAVEIIVGNAFAVKPLSQDGQKARELGKDQGLVALL